jgi:tetratricopeptide (TPR) repeat protein
MKRTSIILLALLFAAPANAQDLKAPPSAKDESPAINDEQDEPDQAQPEDPLPEGVKDQGKVLYLEGRKAFNVGDFKTAVSKFKEAYDLSNKPALLYNIAFAHDKAGDREQAIFFLERYLAEDKGAPQERQAQVTARIKTLKQEKSKADAARADAQERKAAAEARKAAAEQADRELALRKSEKPLYKKWWLWTIVGAVVVGGVVTGVVLGTAKKDAVSPPSELGEIRGGLKFQWR